MTINGDIYLYGFEKHDRGEEGIIFLRYREDEKDERKAEINKSPMYYGGRDTDNYMLIIPKPRERKFDACAVVVRTSKNKYTITAFDDKRIINFKSETVDDVGRSLNEFFGL